MGFSEKVKKKVKQKSAFRCCWCQSSLDIEVHHVVPQEEGGPDTIENAAPLCPTCHSLVGANPKKRKQLKERRDWWYNVVEKMYPDNIMPIKILNEIHSVVKALRFDQEKIEEDMPIEYPFIKIGGADSLPSLLIRISCPSTGKYQDALGLIDSGASKCCIPASYAQILDLDLSKCKVNEVRTATGVTEAYESECGLTIWNTNSLKNDNKMIPTFEFDSIPFLFIPHLKDILLGTEFLNSRILKIDYQRKVFWLDES